MSIYFYLLLNEVWDQDQVKYILYLIIDKNILTQSPTNIM